MEIEIQGTPKVGTPIRFDAVIRHRDRPHYCLWLVRGLPAGPALSRTGDVGVAAGVRDREQPRTRPASPGGSPVRSARSQAARTIAKSC